MMKIVKSCKTHGQLTLEDVYVRNTRKGMDCKWCNSESAKRRREANPTKFKEHGKRYRKIEVAEDVTSRKCSKCQKDHPKDNFANHAWTLRHPYCKACMSIANHKSKIKNRDTSDELKAKAASASRRCYLKKAWGMTVDEFETMKTIQDGQCAICNIKTVLLHIDHDHSTGKVRALLCNFCNRGMGFFKESEPIMLAAIDYLRFHSGKVATQIEATQTTISQNNSASN